MSNPATLAPSGATMTYVRSEPRRDGWFGRFYRALVKSRELQAQRIIDRHLSRLPNEELTELGYSPKEISNLRAKWPAGASTITGY